jgi:hypothetical protein
MGERRRHFTPEQPLKVKTTRPKRANHAQLRGLTKAGAQQRAEKIDRALRNVERGTPGQPARPAPTVKGTGDRDASK